MKYRIVKLANDSYAVQQRMLFFWIHLGSDGAPYSFKTVQECREAIEDWKGKGHKIVKVNRCAWIHPFQPPFTGTTFAGTITIDVTAGRFTSC